MITTFVELLSLFLAPAFIGLGLSIMFAKDSKWAEMSLEELLAIPAWRPRRVPNPETETTQRFSMFDLYHSEINLAEDRVVILDV